ncbi:MAG: MGMT family protein, partial [Thermoplasmata archaeon]
MEINLYNELYSLVKQIPKGRVTTYGDLALALGDIVASRAVGKMLSENPEPMEIPCHRVVMSDGSLGGFTHLEGIIKKIEILRNEGVEI